MCRMYAVRATHVTSAFDELVTSDHSLLRQSKCDLTNRDHSDGWGVASYRGTAVVLKRAASAAHGDQAFDATCSATRSKTIVAHVRRASKGITKLANAHPFVFGSWTFAHNGTLTALDSLRPVMLSEIPQSLRRRIQGETDSELIFYWLLRRLQKAHAIQDDHCRSLSKIRQTLASAVLELDRRNNAVGTGSLSDKQAKLNFLITNGSVLAGTRFRNTLFCLQQKSTRPGGKPFRSVSIASEPPDRRSWQEIPDRSIFSVSSVVEWSSEPMDESFPFSSSSSSTEECEAASN